MAGVSNTHPKWLEFSPLWIKMMDCFKGADHIKAQDTKYLPATPSMIYDGMEAGEDGRKRYDAYKQRSKFPEHVNDAVLQHGGTLHRKPAVVTMPEAMQFLIKRATSKGESLMQLLRRINELQLRDGRVGLLVDLPAGNSPDSKPYIAVYEALSIRNWDDGEDQTDSITLNMVILDESKYVMNHDTYDWNWQIIYRVLKLGSDKKDEAENSGAVYKQELYNVIGTGDNAKDTLQKEVTPIYAGSSLQKIPFVFCNASDLVPEPDRPPLLTLANNALLIYQGEADYRQNLFMTGQDTMIVKGGILNGSNVDDQAPVRVGAGARIDVNNEGDAKYIGVSGQGLAEQRKALEADRADAESRAGSLTNSESASQESGDALRIRTATKTASLVGISQTGAAALESALRFIAEWMGLDPEEVNVVPNVDFSKGVMLGQDFVQIMTGKNLGAPLSYESIHGWLSDNSMTDKSFDEEMTAIAAEQTKYKDVLVPIGTSDQNAEQQAKAPAKTPPATE